MPPQHLDIRDQMRRGVRLQTAERPRPARTALVEHPPRARTRDRKPPMHRAGAGTRTAVEKKHRRAARVADLLQYIVWPSVSGSVPVSNGPDFGEQVTTGHGRLHNANSKRGKGGP